MSEFLTEDQVTDIFSEYLEGLGYEIIYRAKGYAKGVDIKATLGGRILCIEAKGGGSQSKTSKRYGSPFTRLQSNIHTDVAFACIGRMLTRYLPDYVGMVLPDDENHNASIKELIPAIKKLGAGVWLVGVDGVKTICEPQLQNY